MSDLHIYLHFPFETKLDQILAQLAALIGKEDTLSRELDTLTSQVAANTNVEQSAVVLLQGLAAQIVAAQNDPTALNKLASDLNTSATSLSAAIVANTPAA